MPLNNIIDLSHHNARPDFEAARQDGIVGVIHKATQGTKFRDPAYIGNGTRARAAELWWGAYHFGVAGDGAAQADYFLEFVRPDKRTLLVLDYEPNKSPITTMSLYQAEAFVKRIKEKTGRWPGLYSGHLIKEELGNRPPHSIFAQCFLWLAQYSKAPTNIPPTWRTWTLWQYTDGADGFGPYHVDGVGFCDRDKFNGSLNGLRRLWGIPDPNNL